MTNEYGRLEEVPLAKIDRNPENPRLFFRPRELDELTESIRRFGVQVPISVYKEGRRYVLLDGERRWRCSLKINKKTIPAIVQDKPDALTNMVLMFNIHALREQWDLLTIALKLPRVIELYEAQHGIRPNEKMLSEETGLTRSLIRRCRLLMALPKHHIDRIKSELNKPKSQQRVTEDFYIEMERALVTVARALPEVMADEEGKEAARQTILQKYENGTINNITSLRKIAKIARAEKVEVERGSAVTQLQRLFENNAYTIERAYEASVSGAYAERDILTHIRSLIADLEEFEQHMLDDKVTSSLQQLHDEVQRLLEGSR